MKHVKFRAPRVFRHILIGSAGSLFLAAMVGISASADAPKALAGHEIVERNKPGVIVIETVWRGTTLEIADPVIANDDLLQATIRKQIRAGSVHDTRDSIDRAKFHEIAQNPKLYLTRGSTSRTKDTPWGVRGTGFIITPDGYIVTNAHVVEKSKDDLIVEEASSEIQKSINLIVQSIASKYTLSSDDPLRSELERAIRSYYVRGWSEDGGIRVISFDPDQKVITALIPVENGIQMTVKKVAADPRIVGTPIPGKDVAILKIEAGDLPTVQLGDDNNMAQGDQIYIMGFPGDAELDPNEEVGVEATLTAGKFSRRAQVPGGIWKFIQTDAYITHGNSGGPAFNERGEVIGIATYGGGGINYLVPMSIAKQFIEEKNIKPRDSELSSRYREALGLYEAGDYKNAKDLFLKIKEDSAGFPFVQEYIDKCKAKLGNQSPQLNQQILIWGVVAFIVIAIVWFVLRKRGPQVVHAPALPVTQGLAGAGVGGTPKPLPATAAQQSFGSLQCNVGPLSGQRFPVPKQGLKIGRDPSKCQIVIPSDAVSQEHAWVVPLDTGVMLIDSGSTNGVFLNSPDSAKVSKVPLKHGDRIYIGKSVAAFTYQSV
jgi:serine protease Do